MTGWLILLGVGLATLAALHFVARIARNEMLLVLSALFVAAAGYAWQGNPGLAGTPTADRPQQGLKPDTLFMSERMKLLSIYGEAGQWLVFSDGLNRAGEDRAAVSALQGAVAKFPKDVALRIGYAHALLVLADYNVTPAVELAYQRAIAIDPADPSAAYFEGLARFEQGDVARAEKSWRALYETVPTKSPWHDVLAQRLKLFDLLRRGG